MCVFFYVQLTEQFDDARRHVLDFHMSSITTYSQHAKYLASYQGINMSGSREGYIYIYVLIPRYKYVKVQGGIYIYLSSYQGINMSGVQGGIYIYLSSYQGINMSGSREGYTYICLHTKV